MLDLRRDQRQDRRAVLTRCVQDCERAIDRIGTEYASTHVPPAPQDTAANRFTPW